MAKYFEKKNSRGLQMVYAVDTDSPQDWQDLPTAHGRDANYPAAYISYDRGKIHPNFESTYGNYYSTTEAWERSRRKGHVADISDEDGNPTTLFHVQPPHVVELFADPRMRSHVAPLLGHVLNHAQMLGTTIEASDDLSPFSSRLVKRGIKAGLAKGDKYNPEGNVTNSIRESRITLTPQEFHPDYDDEFQEMAPEKVKQASKAGREAIKALKGKPRKKAAPKKAEPQGEQLRLDI